MARPSLGTLAALAVCVLFPAACQAADHVEFVVVAPGTPGAELPESLHGQDLVRLNLVVGRDCPEVLLDEWGIRVNLTFRGRRHDCAIPWSGVLAGVLVPQPRKRPRFGLVTGGGETSAASAPGAGPTALPPPSSAAEPPAAGATVLVDRRAGLALATVGRSRAEELVLEEVPDVSYDDIGGLGEQIGQIRDAVELPFLHRDAFRRYGLTAPKGILLYGPPGCGKTMIAKAVANSLSASTGEKSWFLNIKGPELLNKYVGESERSIRAIFERAREHATEGRPVVVFFDEMDSLFRTRGSGVSSDVENTIVPQLLSEIDGVEGIDNVIIIGASNREDMIDPAILRPGRLDVKIKLDRPTAAGAHEILAKYLTDEVPLHPEVTNADELVGLAVDEVYARCDQNRFLEVTYTSGEREVLMFGDFASGAMLRNIVDRAKKAAIKDELAGGPGGVSRQGIIDACRAEYVENEDLPNTTNPDDWARISGRRGERIVFIRTLVGESHGQAVD